LKLKDTGDLFWDNEREWFLSNGNLYMNDYCYMWNTKKFSKNTEVTFLFETYNFQPSYLIGDKYEVHGGQNNTSISLYLSKKNIWIRKGVFDTTIFIKDITKEDYGLKKDQLNQHKIIVGSQITYYTNDRLIYKGNNPFETYHVGISHWDKMNDEISFVKSMSYK